MTTGTEVPGDGMGCWGGGGGEREGTWCRCTFSLFLSPSLSYNNLKLLIILQVMNKSKWRVYIDDRQLVESGRLCGLVFTRSCHRSGWRQQRSADKSLHLIQTKFCCNYYDTTRLCVSHIFYIVWGVQGWCNFAKIERSRKFERWPMNPTLYLSHDLANIILYIVKQRKTRKQVI